MDMQVFELLHRVSLLTKTAAAIRAGGSIRAAHGVVQDAYDILGDALERLHLELELQERGDPNAPPV